MKAVQGEAAAALAGIPDDALFVSWESIHKLTLELAGMISGHTAETGEQFDKMVVLPRGSYYPANIISRALNFEAPDILHACIGSYAIGKSEPNSEFRLGQMPSREEVEGLDLLIIEEVCDSGKTLHYLANYLHTLGANLVRTGVLHYKPLRNETGFKPDWFAAQTDKWIVYPWEVNEQRGKTSKVRRRKTMPA